jgi:hypothetical protein
LVDAALESFVDRGGHLVAEAAPGEYTWMGFRNPVVPREMFGVRQIEMDAVGSASAGWLDGAWQVETVAVLDATVLLDGDFKVTRRSFGAGQVTLIGSYPSLAGSSFVDLLGPLERPVTWDALQPGLISRTARLADGRRAVFLVNWTHEPQRCSLRRSSYVVPPRSGAVLIDVL